MINSMAKRNSLSSTAMVEMCRRTGDGFVVAGVHPDDAKLAKKVEKVMIWVVGAVLVVVMAVILYLFVALGKA